MIAENIDKGRLDETDGDAIFPLVLVVAFRREGVCRPVAIRLIFRNKNCVRTVGTLEAHGPFFWPP